MQDALETPSAAPPGEVRQALSPGQEQLWYLEQISAGDSQLTHHVLPGGHLTLFQPPHVTGLARLIDRKTR